MDRLFATRAPSARNLKGFDGTIKAFFFCKPDQLFARFEFNSN